jgi:uncharacterized protein
MRIGLLSDTHGHLDPRVFTHFATCDEVWHAGDIGDGSIVSDLQKFPRFKAVFGNIDTKDIQRTYPEDLRFECEGLDILITHIAGSPPKYNPRMKKILAHKPPHILICGHSHILRVKRDPAYNNMLYINPGAAGNHGFHTIKTIMRFEIKDGKIDHMEVIELGRRGALT